MYRAVSGSTRHSAASTVSTAPSAQWTADDMIGYSPSSVMAASTVNPMSISLLNLDPNSARSILHRIISSAAFNGFILLVIIFNTILMGCQSTQYLNQNYTWYFSLLDMLFLGIYIAEAGIKLAAYRVRYFHTGWNLLDFFIVVSSIISFLLPYLAQAAISVNTRIIRLVRVFRAFRALRSLRVLRTVSMFRNLQILVETLLRSIPAMSSIAALMGLLIYMFGVIARSAYHQTAPQWFATLPRSLFSLYSFMTLDDWSKLWVQLRNEDGTVFPFVFVFVFLEALVLLNLFVAVIVSNLESGSRLFAQKMAKLNAQSEPPPITASVDDLLAATTAHRARTKSRMFEDTPLAALQVDRMAAPDMNWYYAPSTARRLKDVQGSYFALLATAEHDAYAMARQLEILDDLVDVIKTTDSKNDLT
ncbi:Cation channel sperm-associated protein 1 [Allomyces arbusculus]|nr:Cation channel sperm-associated protein 1 [Allomyces arbusculus]